MKTIRYALVCISVTCFALTLSSKNRISPNTTNSDETPVCSVPNQPAGFKNYIDEYVILWNDIPAAFNSTRYEIRYKPQGLAIPWESIFAYTGNKINIGTLQKNIVYVFEIRKICDGSGSDFTLASAWVSLTIYPPPFSGDGGEPNCDLLNALQISNPPNELNISGSFSFNVTGHLPIAVIRQCDANGEPSTTPQFFDLNNYIVVNNGVIDFNISSIPNLGFSVSSICQLELNYFIMLNGIRYPYCDGIIWNKPAFISRCGASPINIPPPTGGLKVLYPGDIVFINKIPFQIDQVSGEGIWNGKGHIMFPIGGLKIASDFENIKVKNNYEVYAGSITPLSSLSKKLPTPQIGQIVTCVAPAEETPDTSSLGFDENGLYVIDPPYEGYEPPMPFDPQYDPNGFNSDGIHVNTGTEFNEDGCNVEGLDKNGLPCISKPREPYYWMLKPAETIAGIKFIQEKSDSIELLLRQYLEELNIIYIDSVDIVLDECTLLFDSTVNKAGNMNIDQEIVGGNSNKYLSENLSEQYKKSPLRHEGYSFSRTEDQKELENKYLKSYECDVKLNSYKKFSTFINELNEDRFQPLLDKLFEKGRSLDSLIVGKLENPDSLYRWIIGFTNKYIKDNFVSDIGYNDVKKEKTLKLFPIEERITSLCNINSPKNQNYLFPDQDSFLKIINGQLNSQLNNYFPGDPNAANLLPLEVTNLIGGSIFSIWIDDVHIGIDSLSCTFDAYLYFRVPSTGQDIVFKGENIRFSQTGALIDKLVLISNVEVKVSNNLKLILKSNNTFAQFDCNGYKSLTLSADLEFCRTYLTPVNPNTYETINDENVKVRGHFDQITITSWKDLYIGNISIDAFSVTKFPQFAFVVQEASLDLSSTISPTGVQLPQDYISQYASNNTLMPGWKGVYIGKVEVVSKQKFSQGDSTLKIQGENMLFDNMGFTGFLSLKKDILSLDKGRIGNWAFSIDSIVVQFVCNNLKGGGFGGKLLLPIAGSPSETDLEANAFKYSAFIGSNGRYVFSVNTGQKFKAGLWLADVTLKNSSIDVFDSGDGFNIVAKLNGKLEINPNANFADKKLTVDFTNLVIKNHKPYITFGQVLIKDTIGIGFKGFELAFFDIGAKELPGDKVDFSFSAKVEIIGGAMKIGAGANLSIIGSFTTVNGRHQWQHDDFKISGVNIDASIKGKLSVKGSLIFYEDDPSYGTGFYGSVKLDVMKKFSIDAVAQFGKLKNPDGSENYRYFLVDAFVQMENSPIIFMGMQMYGFGGGVFYNMKRDGDLVSLEGTPRPFGIGRSISGIVYTPQEGTYSFKAAVALALASNKKLLSINAALEMQFSNSGGNFSLDAIYFEGNGRLLTAPKFLANIQKLVADGTNGTINLPTALSANLRINIILGSDPSMDGSLNVFLNVGNVLTGVGANGSMGECRIVVSKRDSNFVYIGTPMSPMGIKIKVGDAVKLSATMYLCIGDPIPNAFPPLPEEISDLDKAESLVAQRNANDIRTAGVMFGFCIKGEINSKWWPVKGYFNFGIGADFAFKHYKYGNGDIVRCSNNGNEEIGINGFYATGQIYAWASGSAEVLGIEQGSFSIKALLKAGGPNPVYGYARLKINYIHHNPLHGSQHKICPKLKLDVDVEFGEECQFNQGGSNNIKQNTPDELIVSTSPNKFENDVPITSDIVVEYAMEVNKNLNLPDYEGNPHVLFLKTERFEVRTKGGEIVNGVIKNDMNRKRQTFVPSDGLPPNSTIILTVQATATIDGTNPQTQIRSDTFYTGRYNDTLKLNMVESSFPTNGELCYYKGDNNVGILKLKPNINNFRIFEKVDNDGYRIGIEFLEAGSNKRLILRENHFQFKKELNQLEFKIPHDLINGKIYKLVIKRFKVVNDPYTGPSMEVTPVASISYTDLPSISPFENVIISYEPTANENKKWELPLFFRVSNYNTLSAKINSFVESIGTNAYFDASGVLMSTANEMLEPFTMKERAELNFLPPMVNTVDCPSYTGDFSYYFLISNKNCFECDRQNPWTDGSGIKLVKQSDFDKAVTSITENCFLDPNLAISFSNVREKIRTDYIYRAVEYLIYLRKKANTTTCSDLHTLYDQYKMDNNHVLKNPYIMYMSRWKLLIFHLPSKNNFTINLPKRYN